jgi:hypothetical protein
MTKLTVTDTRPPQPTRTVFGDLAVGSIFKLAAGNFGRFMKTDGTQLNAVWLNDHPGKVCVIQPHELVIVATDAALTLTF